MSILKEHQSVTCVYKILNRHNGMFYIGSTNNFKRRVGRHKTELKHGIHNNRYLQNAYNKYGLEYFEFIVIEEFDSKIDRLTLFKREAHYIKTLNPLYNLIKEGNTLYPEEYSGSADFSSKEYFVSFLGQPEFKIKNLKKFCRDKNLRKNSIYCVLSGEYSHTKGWKIRRINESYRIKEAKVLPNKFVVRYLNEPEFPITNLRYFCRERSLSKSGMECVLIGKCEYHRGWRCRRITDLDFKYKKKEKPFHKKVIFPDGKIELVSNLNEFCRQNNLNKFVMLDICRGKSSSHRGFRIENYSVKV